MAFTFKGQFKAELFKEYPDYDFDCLKDPIDFVVWIQHQVAVARTLGRKEMQVTMDCGHAVGDKKTILNRTWCSACSAERIFKVQLATRLFDLAKELDPQGLHNGGW